MITHQQPQPIAVSPDLSIDSPPVTSVRLRVALLMDHPSPHMVGLLDALASRDDIAAQVIYFRPGAPERSWGDPPGDLPYQFASQSKRTVGLLNVPAVTRTMRSVRADVWVVNSCYTAPETWAAIRYLNNAGLPWVYMNEPVRMRGGTDALKRSVLRKMLSRASGIIGMGTEAQVQYCKIVIRESPSISVPYLPDLDDFLELPQAQPPTNSEPVRFFAAAQLIHRKGLDVLLAACSRLTESGWTLTIAGDGPLRSNLRREFGKRFGSDRVRFIGQIPYKDRANVFAKHHAFVFPSRWDGWGVAPVEAMAAGLPVISSDTVISMREIIREGKNGYLVPSENPQLLAERMQQLIASPHKLSTMGQSARASLADYVPTNGARRLADFLLELTNPNRIDSKEAPQTISPGTA